MVGLLLLCFWSASLITSSLGLIPDRPNFGFWTEPHTPLRFSPEAGFWAKDIAFVDGNVGIAVANDGVILRTEDGGVRWRPFNRVQWAERRVEGLQKVDQRTTQSDPAEKASPQGSLPGVVDRIVPKFADGALRGDITLLEVKLTTNGEGWVRGSTADHGLVLLSTVDGGVTWSGWDLRERFNGEFRGLSVDADGNAYLLWESTTGALSPSFGKVILYATQKDGVVRVFDSPLPSTIGAVPALSQMLAFGGDGEPESRVPPKGAIAVFTDFNAKPVTFKINSEPFAAIAFWRQQNALLIDFAGSVIAMLDRGRFERRGQLPGKLAVRDIVYSGEDDVWTSTEFLTFRSRDRGRTWAPVGGLTELRTLGFNNQIGWAISGRQMLITGDGGQTWHDRRKFTRYPSLQSWMQFILGLGLVLPIFFQSEPPVPEKLRRKSIANFYLSDKPIDDPKHAANDLVALAEGVADFLSNSNTGAPLVLGVCGPWGSGKSSLINLVRHRLGTRRFHPVAFNAWHHEQEQHFLAALIQSIGQEAIPPILSWHGLAYRWNLARQRFHRRWAFVAVMLVLAAFVISFISTGGLTAAKLDFTSTTAFITGLIGLLPWGAVAAPVIALLRLLGAFGVDPGRLALSQVSKASDLRALTSARHQFATDFGEVTRALKPKRMVIFIDDLDRCQPDHMLRVLETVNFLATSGEVFIVLSMEKRAVLACLAKMLTGWTEQYKETFPGQPVPTPSEYADLWLQKLVQVEVTVPKLTSEEMQTLAGAKPIVARTTTTLNSAPSTAWQRFMKKLLPSVRSVAVTVTTALAIGFAVWIGFKTPKPVAQLEKAKEQTWFLSGELSKEGRLHVKATDRQPADFDPTAVALDKREPSEKDLEPGENRDVDVGPPLAVQTAASVVATVEPAKKSFVHYLIAGISALIAAGFLIFATKQLRRFFRETITDSEEFRSAVAAWWPEIEQQQQTPRDIKRLVNRLRLYASLVRNTNEAGGSPLISERVIVGFGVMEKVCPDVLRDELEHRRDQIKGIVRLQLKLGDELANEARQVITALNKSQIKDTVRRLTAALRT